MRIMGYGCLSFFVFREDFEFDGMTVDLLGVNSSFNDVTRCCGLSSIFSEEHKIESLHGYSLKGKNAS